MLNWLDGAQIAGSTDSSRVLKALTSNPNPKFVFGGGKWWGKELWGRDNIVVGRWPVVVIEGGKTRIKEFASVTDWLDKHSDVLIKYMKSHGLRTVA
jgi:branched-chain amino acid transport system substrate-binding protein